MVNGHNNAVLAGFQHHAGVCLFAPSSIVSPQILQGGFFCHLPTTHHLTFTTTSISVTLKTLRNTFSTGLNLSGEYIPPGDRRDDRSTRLLLLPRRQSTSSKWDLWHTWRSGCSEMEGKKKRLRLMRGGSAEVKAGEVGGRLCALTLSP